MLSLVMMDTLGETAHHSNYLELIFIQELAWIIESLSIIHGIRYPSFSFEFQ